MKKELFKEKGFSLIELLVVIALIGILSTLALMSFTGARAKARDAKRKADLHQVQTALGVFYDDRGTYPTSTAAANYDSARADYGTGVSTSTSATDYNDIGVYIRNNVAILPTDPLNPTNDAAVNDHFCYKYISDVGGTNFALVFETENEEDASPYVVVGW